MKRTRHSSLISRAPTGQASAYTAAQTVTIVDDDPTPTLSVNDTGVVEGNSGSVPLVFTVSLSAASGRSVSVNYATTPNTATAGIDFTSVSGTLTFAPGVVTQTVSVWVVPDVTDEPDEGMFVDLTGPTGATGLTREPAASFTTTIPHPSHPRVTSIAMDGRISSGATVSRATTRSGT